MSFLKITHIVEAYDMIRSQNIYATTKAIQERKEVTNFNQPLSSHSFITNK